MDINAIANERKKVVDSLTEREEIISFLFYCCFFYEIGNFKLSTLKEDSKYLEFESFCKTNNLQEYAPYLYVYCNVFKVLLEERKDTFDEKKALNEKYLLELMLPLYSKNHPQIEIKTNLKTDSIGKSSDPELLSYIKDFLTKRYFNQNYNRIRLSELRKKFEKNSNDVNIIDYNYLKDRLDKISKVKRGAPTKDSEVLGLVLNIIYLLRFDAFTNQGIPDIIEYLDTNRLTNKEFLIINDCLCFFDLSLPQKANSSSPISNYMRRRVDTYQKRIKRNENSSEAYLNHLRLYLRNGTNLSPFHRLSHIEIKEVDYKTFQIN